MTLLNRKWRQISESPRLYAHHLSQCQSSQDNVISSTVSIESLAPLKRKFLSKIRRNAFDAFLRPRSTLLKLTSASISSSTAFPLGEAFRFIFSTNGHMLLCISSSRIFVLDVASECHVVKFELKTWRRPLNATILDDGSLLAVVSSRHQVNIYSLSSQEAKHIQGLVLNDAPRDLALSPTGGVLAMAYDDSIEVHALGEGVLIPQRRAVRCAGVDSISFSSDGMLLIGSSISSHQNIIVTIAAPFHTESETDLSLQELQVQMWTTQVLFPSVIPCYSHACLIPNTEGEGNWLMGYDKQSKFFRVIRTNDAKVGAVCFVNPPSTDGTQNPPPPVTIPTTDHDGELTALGFQDGGLWLYGIPEHLPFTYQTHETCETTENNQTAASPSLHEPSSNEFSSMPQVESMPKEEAVGQQNIMVNGRKMADIPGITATHWVQPGVPSRGNELGRRRLVAVAPGGLSPPTFGEGDMPVDSGRVLLLDFGRSIRNGEAQEINVELGETEPMMLREHNPSMDTAVELERTRTRLHHRGSSPQNLEGRPSMSSSRQLSSRGDSPSRTFRNTSHAAGPSSGVDATHARSSARFGDTLRRAATAATSTHRTRNQQYRPSLPRIPHESDADNWVPPPPPYSREPEAPLPDSLRRTLLPGDAEPVPRGGDASLQNRTVLSTQLSGTPQLTRSQSIFQAFDTIASSRFAFRRRSSVEPGVEGIDQRQRNSSQPLLSIRESQETQTGRLQSQPINSTSIQAPEASTRYPGPVFQAVPHNQTVPNLPSTPIMTYQANQDVSYLHDISHAFSVSTPDLHLSIPGQNFPQHATAYVTTEPHPQFQGSQHLFMPGRMRSVSRRASTDPTPSPARQDSNEDWRRRIEDWNEQTIRERSRRNRLRCVVM